MGQEAEAPPRILSVIAAIAIVQGALNVLGGLALLVIGFTGSGGYMVFGGLVAVAVGVLLVLSARGLPALNNPSRRRLVALEWLLLVAALIVTAASSKVGLVDVALAATVIVTLTFTGSLAVPFPGSPAGAFPRGFHGHPPPGNLVLLPGRGGGIRTGSWPAAARRRGS